MAKHKLTKADSKKGGQISKRPSLKKEWADKLYAIEKGTSDIDEIFNILKEMAFDRDLGAIRELLDRSLGPIKKDVKVELEDTRPQLVLPQQQIDYINGDKDESDNNKED